MRAETSGDADSEANACRPHNVHRHLLAVGHDWRVVLTCVDVVCLKNMINISHDKSHRKNLDDKTDATATTSRTLILMQQDRIITQQTVLLSVIV